MCIFTVGLSCFDQFFFVNGYPEENCKYVASDSYESGGSPSSNAAYLLGTWGESCYHVSHIGRDIYSKSIIQELQTVGVKTDYIFQDTNIVTPLANITVNTLNGSRTIILRRSTNKKPLEQLDISSKIKCSTILIDGHEPELSELVIKQFPDAKVVMDGGSLRESNIKLAKYTDFMVVSERFALDFSEMKSFETKEDIYQALVRLKEICRGVVVVTLGERGSAYLDYNVSLKTINKKSEVKDIQKSYQDDLLKIIPSYQVNAIDTTGAGDVYHGAFTYGVSKNWDIERIIKFSSKAAALSVRKKGVRKAMPTITELEKAKLKINETFNI